MSKSRTPLYQELAGLVGARRRCKAANNTEWYDKRGADLAYLATNFLPHGSGVDSGTVLDLDASTDKKLVLRLSYHHMNDGGMYDGWTEHTAIVTPSFSGFDLRITGRDRNDIKDYLGEILDYALKQHVWQEYDGTEWQWRTERYHQLGDKVEGGLGI